MFNAAIKEISPDAISVSANVYSLAELAENSISSVPNLESVSISSDEDDNSETLQVKIPELGTIAMTEETIEKCEYATVTAIDENRNVSIAYTLLKDSVCVSHELLL